MDNTPEISMFFGKRPSGTAGVMNAIWNRRHVRKNRKKPGQISAIMKDIRTDAKHVGSFNRICRVPNTGCLHPLYPLSYVYPLTVRVLGHKKSGIDIFKSLNTRSWIRQYRKVGMYEILNVHCTISDRRILEKGMELDVSGKISSGGQLTWECCYTFFVKGRFGEPTVVQTENGFPDIQNPVVRGEWFLEKKDAFRFAGISGDTNGIHYWDIYARMLGFKGAFAQPVLVFGRSHESMPLTDMEAFSFEQRLKGPVYYNSRVMIKSSSPLQGNVRYDIYCGDNPKPCICCQVKAKTE